VAVFTKYDDFVKRFQPADDDYFGGDIEEEIKNLNNRIDPDLGLTIGANESPINPSVLPLADEELCKMIKPFEKTLGVPWVAVSGLHRISFRVPDQSNCFGHSKTWFFQHSR
jgi:hypothetical protein